MGGEEIFDVWSDPSPKRKARSIRDLSRRLEGSATLKGLQGQSLLALLDGNAQRATKLLEMAIQRAPRNVTLLTDLSLAYLMRARLWQSPEDLVRALAISERALALDSHCEEALFNRALILDRLCLNFQATLAWNNYISNPANKWQGLAWQNLVRHELPTLEDQWEICRRAIEKALDLGGPAPIDYVVSHFPQSARVFVQEDLLPRWARARSEGQPTRAGQFLALAREMASSLAQFNREFSAIDEVAEIDLAEKQGRGRDMALAYISYRVALDGFDKGKAEEALDPLRRTWEIFHSMGGHSSALWATFWCARADYLLGDVKSAQLRIGEILQASDISRYPALQGRALWARGLFSMLEARFGLALSYYRRAVESFERLREVENTGAVEALIAEDLSLLGREKEAWGYRLKALTKLGSYSYSIRLHNLLIESADKLLIENETAVAASIQAEDQEVARRVGTGSARAESLLLQSRIRSQQGDFKGAYRHLVEAQNEIGRIKNAARRERLRADAALAEGEFARLVPPSTMLSSLYQAISYYDGKGLFSLGALGHLLRARVYLLLDNEDNAQRDLEDAISLRWSNPETPEGLRTRVALQGPWQAVFEDILELRSNRDNNLDKVFSLLEQVRNRNRSFRSLRSAQTMNPNDIIISYALLRNRLVSLVVSSSKTDFVLMEVDRARLEKDIEDFESHLRRGEDATSVRELACALFDRLVKPIMHVTASKSGRWIIVADGVLGQVPFAALVDSRTGRYLIEDAAIQYSPSVSDAIDITRRQRRTRKGRANSRLVAVGEPRVDLAAYPELQSLPGAANEAREVASLYSHHELLIGERATPRAFLAAIARADVVHIAGHASVNPIDADFSRLFFAPERQGELESVIYLRDLKRLKLRKQPLFILSGCETASAVLREGENVENFARVLLDAGASGVLASRWIVNDEAAVEVLHAFHRAYVSGLDPAAALREGQMTLISKEKPVAPGVWATFSLYGQGRR